MPVVFDTSNSASGFRFILGKYIGFLFIFVCLYCVKNPNYYEENDGLIINLSKLSPTTDFGFLLIFLNYSPN